jgi:hypothetical protein
LEQARHIHAGPQEGQASLARTRSFALALAILPMLAVAGSIVVARSGWFIHQAVPPYLAMIDAEYGPGVRPCDVLIFGDSAALTGFQPWTIHEHTGLTTCNIAQTKGSVGVSGLRFLRLYLSAHPAPRVLILAFAPEDWRPIHAWGEVAYVEGVLQLVRHAPFRVYAAALAKHPNEAFGFTTFVYESAASALATGGRASRWAAPGSTRDGHMTLPFPAQTACVGGSAAMPLEAVTPSPEYVRSLRQEFSSPQTMVLLLSPTIPDCDARRDFFAARLDPVLDMPVETQPVGFYNDVDRHFTSAGSDQFSLQVAALVTQRLQAEKP